MNRILSLFFIGLLTFVILLFIARPELLSDVWLWLVGLSGGILRTIKSVFEYFKKGDKEEKELALAAAPAAVQQSNIITPIEASTIPAPAPVVVPETKTPVKKIIQKISVKEPFKTLPNSIVNQLGEFNGTTLTVLRCIDDGSTTVGWLYVNNAFFCYTLEDTHRDEKIKGETRIPKGTYTLGYREMTSASGKTAAYQKRYAPWFKYHLHVKEVPNFKYIYIHVGNKHEDTHGCLLVAKNVSEKDKMTITSSRVAYEELYKLLYSYHEQGTKMRIVYLDESWIKTLNT